MFEFIAFILVIFPLIIIHEYGHLIVGKYLGAKPVKFAIGFGKPFFSKKIGDVEYSLRPYPLGGFVEFATTQFPGLEKEKEELESWKWIFISLAGPIANFLFTFLILFLLTLFKTDLDVIGSFSRSIEILVLMFSKYFELFSNIFSGEFLKSVSGPVGIAKASADAVSSGFLGYLKLSVMLSFALGFMNLIPLTILDGGRALISFVETISRKKINEKVFQYTSMLSMLMLFLLLIYTVYKDLIQ